MAGGSDPEGKGLPALRRMLDRDMDELRARERHGAPCHVWVADAHPAAPGRRAGLLVEWVRRDDGWWGRVVVGLDDGAVLTVWVPAGRLERA